MNICYWVLYFHALSAQDELWREYYASMAKTHPTSKDGTVALRAPHIIRYVGFPQEAK